MIFADDYKRGEVPPGRYAAGGRSPIVAVFLCAGCAGFAPFTDEDYEGFLSGQCNGCGQSSRELHRFRAWIDTACGCRCRGGHDQMFGDVWAADHAEKTRDGAGPRD